jgi:HKD family nuclease
MLDALTSMADPTLKSVRAAVAYTSYGGVTTLMPSLRRFASRPSWSSATKSLITSFDMGITDPAALRYLSDEHGFAIRIANSGEAKANYHPKLYVFGRDDETAALIGSANLSGRALAANTEIAALIDPYPQPAELDQMWELLEATSHELTEVELAAYAAERPKRRRRIDPDSPVPSRLLPTAVSLPAFPQLVESGLDPMSYDALWVEAGLVSGGSQSQVELPRLANRFFGADFDHYDEASVTPIADLELLVGASRWSRPLRWHGDNRMERINLPTPRESGLTYSGHFVRFRRMTSGFVVDTAPDGSALAASWIEASRELGTLCRVGERTNRRCGLLEPR